VGTSVHRNSRVCAARAAGGPRGGRGGLAGSGAAPACSAAGAGPGPAEASSLNQHAMHFASGDRAPFGTVLAQMPQRSETLRRTSAGSGSTTFRRKAAKGVP
jgi:hypothetical protein